MFGKKHLDALFNELNREWKGKPEYDRLLRQAHLAIALSDAGRPLGNDLDPRTVTLINKHKPKS